MATEQIHLDYTAEPADPDFLLHQVMFSYLILLQYLWFIKPCVRLHTLSKCTCEVKHSHSRSFTSTWHWSLMSCCRLLLLCFQTSPDLGTCLLGFARLTRNELNQCLQHGKGHESVTYRRTHSHWLHPLMPMNVKTTDRRGGKSIFNQETPSNQDQLVII